MTRRSVAYTSLVASAIVAGLWCAPLAAAGPDDGVIDVWYGPVQHFGYLGNAQRWVNILGNANDPDGIDTLTYTLNGGPDQTLGVGPDTRRLQKPGDFNVEIDRVNLVDGVNSVVITLTDSLGFQTQTSVSVNFDSVGVWSDTYSVDWTNVTNIQDVVQVVDGDWEVSPAGARTVQLGYDRVLAVGDVTWDNYEVTANITIHGIDPNGFVFPSIAPGMGITLRWLGHSIWDNWQPNIGWLPSGGTIWYDWGDQGGRLKVFGEDGLTINDNSGRKLSFDVDYIFKMRGETQPGEGTQYSVKIWEASQAEPNDWDF